MFTRSLLALAGILLTACHTDSVVSVPSDGRNQSVKAEVGQEIMITLGNVGPGEFVSPPEISSSAVSYRGVEVVPPFTPAGPNQRFSFRAESAGRAIVRFSRVRDESVIAVVADTIDVR